MKTRSIAYSLGLFVALIINAQQGDYFMSIQKYPFINYNKNQITFPSDSNYFEPFYAKLDSIILFGEGKVNIVHIGGSHIQADIYTHQVRKHLQSLQYDMNGGRGIIFPYKMAQTNNPSNYKVSYTGEWEFCKNTKYQRTCELGLTGYSVSTTSKNANVKVDISADSTVEYKYNRVKVFHAPTKFVLSVITPDSVYTSSYDTTNGYTEFILPQSNLFDLSIQNNDTLITEFKLFGFLFENDDAGIVYSTIGVNGAKLESFLYCNLYQQQIRTIQPDLVIFSVGTNDGNTKYFNEENYFNEYKLLIEKTREACPNTLIMITVPNDAYYYKRYVNKNTPLIRQQILRLANKENYAIWDFFSIMGGLNSSQKWYNYDIMRYDRVHFSRKGYLLKGDLFVTALLRGWEKNLAGRTINYIHDEKLTQHISLQTNTP
jgi:lysophospholipase L1-like esterase